MRELILRDVVPVDVRGRRGGPCDIVVEGDRIRAITRRARRAGAEILDLDGAFVVPGLVNMHAHLSFVHPGTTEAAAVAGEDAAARVLRMAGNARKALRAGVTTLRLVGEPDGLELCLRRAIEHGHVDGPRIFTAGSPLTYAGGHGGAVGAIAGEGAAEFRALALELAGRPVDLLKVMVNAGAASEEAGIVRMSLDEFSAIRYVARSRGLRIAVHTSAVPHAILDLLIADGVDSLEHCYLLEEPALTACVAKSLLLVLTPLVSRSDEYFRRIGCPPAMLDAIRRGGEAHWAAVCAAVAAGARIALGTDHYSHVENTGTWAVVRELELYEEAGADPLRLLGIAGRNGAEWLGLSDELGLVEEGYSADLLVLGRNPLDGAAAFRDMRLVVARGRPQPIEPAEAPVGHDAARAPFASVASALASGGD